MRFSPLFVTCMLAALAGFITGMIDVAFICAERYFIHLRIEGFSHFSTMWIVLLVAALAGGIAFWLTFSVAPEVSGSGIPQVKEILHGGAMKMRWRRVIPIKFVATLQLFSCGMLLGERPTIQVGAYTGKMVADVVRIRSYMNTHLLIAAGAAGGMAAAFNSPLAATFFMLEEMRMNPRLKFINVAGVLLIGALTGMLARWLWLGNVNIIGIHASVIPYFSSLWWLVMLGVFMGIAGVLFNRSLLRSLDLFQRFYNDSLLKKVLTGVLLAMFAVFVADFWPSFTSNEIVFARDIMQQTSLSVMVMLTLLCARYVLFMLFYGSGAPGGIFAPMISLGCILGLLCDHVMGGSLNIANSRGVFAVLCMGGLFSASVRTPVTGMLLTMELTHNYALFFPLLTVSYVAAWSAKLMKGKPIYKALLYRSKKMEKRV